MIKGQHRWHVGNAINEDYRVVECCDTCLHGSPDEMSCFVCVEDGTKCPDFDTKRDDWRQWQDDHYIQSSGFCGKYVNKIMALNAKKEN